MLIVGYSHTLLFAMDRDDWIGLLPRPMGYMYELIGNMTTTAMKEPSGAAGATGFFQWFVAVRIQCEGWFSSGLFGVVTGATGWASSKICMIVLGKQSCEAVQNALTLISALLILGLLLYGIDWLLRPPAR